MACFSKNYQKNVNVILTDCTLYYPDQLVAGMKCPLSLHTENVAWDTGATDTYISKEIVDKLHLQPKNPARYGSAAGDVDTTTYLVHLQLPDGSVIPNLEVIMIPDMDYDVLIGMDIISSCDFCFTNKDGQSVFSFRIPSSEHIELK